MGTVPESALLTADSRPSNTAAPAVPLRVIADFRAKNSFIIDDYQELLKILQADGGYVYSHWCGDQACEEKIKTETSAVIRCLALGQKQEAGKCIVCGKPSTQRAIFAKSY